MENFEFTTVLSSGECVCVCSVFANRRYIRQLAGLTFHFGLNSLQMTTYSHNRLNFRHNFVTSQFRHSQASIRNVAPRWHCMVGFGKPIDVQSSLDSPNPLTIIGAPNFALLADCSTSLISIVLSCTLCRHGKNIELRTLS